MVLLEKKPHENARRYAIRVLLYNIVTLKLAPGSAISENDISNFLGISRTPVREALIELTRLNIVEILPQRGSYITRIDYELIEESRFVRLAVESAVFKKACKEISEDHIRLLEINLENQRKVLSHPDAEAFLFLDNEFHRIVWESIGMSRSYTMIHEQMIHFDRLRSLSLSLVPSEYTVRDHEDLLYALKRNDPEMCEMLLTRHLSRHQIEKEGLVKKYPDYFV